METLEKRKLVVTRNTKKNCNEKRGKPACQEKKKFNDSTRKKKKLPGAPNE